MPLAGLPPLWLSLVDGLHGKALPSAPEAAGSSGTHGYSGFSGFRVPEVNPEETTV